ncbi:MAG: transposase, partial [Desulfovibrio sp.]|nr:transposase [Desulfovibrio sp.]
GKNLHWLWVLGNRQLTYFRIDPHRSAEAFQALLKDWSGYLISDDYGVYRSWAYGRQTCLAHLIREARNLSESTNHDTACCGRRIKKIFQHICELEGSPPAERVLTLLRKRFYRVALDFGHLTGRAENLIMRMINEFS